MGQHDKYGKELLSQINDFSQAKEHCQFSYGDFGTARIDGVIINKIAIEIESRVNKQIRGALLDLICHSNEKKLLILMSVKSVSDNAIKEAEYILTKFIKDSSKFKVIKLEGNGDNKKIDIDTKIIIDGLKYLGHNKI